MAYYGVSKLFAMAIKFVCSGFYAVDLFQIG